MYDTIRRRRQLQKQLRQLRASRNRTTVIGKDNRKGDNSDSKIFNMLLVQNQQLIMQQHNMMLMMINRCYNGTPQDQNQLLSQLPTTSSNLASALSATANATNTTNDNGQTQPIMGENLAVIKNDNLGSTIQITSEQQSIPNRGWISGTTLAAHQQQQSQQQSQQQVHQVSQHQQVQQIHQIQQHVQQVQQTLQPQQVNQIQQVQLSQQPQQQLGQRVQHQQQQQQQQVQQVQQLFDQISNSAVSANQHSTHMQRPYLHTPAASEQDPMSDRPDDELLYTDHQDENDTTLQHLSDALYNPSGSLVYTTPFKNDDFYAFKNISDFSSNSSECESLSTPRVDREPINQINTQNVAKNLNNQFKTPIKNSEHSAGAGVRTPCKLQQASENLTNTTSPGGISIQIVPNGNNNMRDSKARIIQSMNISKFLRQVHPEASVDKQ